MKKIILIFTFLYANFLVAQPILVNKTGCNDSLVKYYGFEVSYLPKYRMPLYSAYVATKKNADGGS